MSQLRAFVGGRETWTLVDQAMVSGTNFFTNVLLARTSGAEVFGAFALAWIIIMFVNLIQDALIIAPMMSVQPKLKEDEHSTYLGSVLVHVGIFATCSAIAIQAVCYLGGTYFHRPEMRSISAALSAAMFCYLTQDFTRRYLLTIRRGVAAIWIDLLSYPAQLLLIGMIAVFHRPSAQEALWIVALTSASGFVLSFRYIGPIVISSLAIRKVATRHWGMSRWLTFSVLLEWTSNNLFFLIAPIYLGAAAAAIIRVSQNLVGIAHIWFMGLANVVPAETARALHERGIDAAEQYIKYIVFKWGGLTAIFVSVLVIAPGHLLHFVYGAQYAPYGYLLRQYGLLYLMVFFNCPFRSMLQALEVTAPIFWANVVVACFSLVVAVPLIHRFGLEGVPAGAIAAQFLLQALLGAMMFVRIRKYRSDPQRASQVKAIGPTDLSL